MEQKFGAFCYTNGIFITHQYDAKLYSKTKSLQSDYCVIIMITATITIPNKSIMFSCTTTVTVTESNVIVIVIFCELHAWDSEAVLNTYKRCKTLNGNGTHICSDYCLAATDTIVYIDQPFHYSLYRTV